MSDKFWYFLVGPTSCCFVLFIKLLIAEYLFPSLSSLSSDDEAVLVEIVFFLIFPTQQIGTAYLYFIRRNLPSQPMGRHQKLGLDLINLFVPLIVGLYFGFDPFHLIYLGGFITEFYIICQFYCHPPDLGVLDWAFHLLMLVVLYSVCSYKYGFIASIVVYVALIFERYRSYSCPCPISRRQNLEEDITCLLP